MNPVWSWLLITFGIVFFVLAAYLDDHDVRRFTDPSKRQPSESVRLLWARIITRQVAAFILVLMLDALSTTVNQSAPPLQQQLNRLFIALAEVANLWQLPRYHRLIKQAVARARALQTLRGENLS